MLNEYHKSWHPFLKAYASFLQEINVKLQSEKAPIYPPKSYILNALKLTPLSEVKVLLLGQDPYHGAGQAMGLSFSVQKGVKIPPSLKNIYKELQSDLDISPPEHGDLTSWAKQGVLLLNASLSVREHEPNSHAHLWGDFTDELISYVSKNCPFVVFLLWGNFAKSKAKFIDERHSILSSAHPSPFSVKNFFGCRHFSRANEELKKQGKEPINWALD